MSETDMWARACNASRSRSKSEVTQASNVAHGVAISIFALGAIFSAIVYLLEYRLLRWRLIGKEVEGDRIWNNLRRFSGWTCAGCIAGAVGFSLRMQSRDHLFESTVNGVTRREVYELEALTDQYASAGNIFFPLNLLCVIFAMNLLLQRVSDHASHSYYNEARDHHKIGQRSVNINRCDWRDCVGEYTLYYLVRYVHKIVIALCVLNILVRVVVSGFQGEASGLRIQAAAATNDDGSDSSISRGIVQNSLPPSIVRRNITIAVSRVLESAVLVIVASSFLLLFPTCIVMFHRVERRLDNIVQEMSLRSDHGNAFLPFEFSPPAADGSETQVELPIVEVRQFLRSIKSSATAQRRRFMFCLLFALASLFGLSSLAVFVAFFSSSGAAQSVDCGLCNPSCQPFRHLLEVWYNFTPELLPLVSSLCSTLPLVFALWLMTTPEDRALLLHPDRFRTELIALQPDISGDDRLRAERIRMGIVLR